MKTQRKWEDQARAKENAQRAAEIRRQLFNFNITAEEELAVATISDKRLNYIWDFENMPEDYDYDFIVAIIDEVIAPEVADHKDEWSKFIQSANEDNAGCPKTLLNPKYMEREVFGTDTGYRDTDMNGFDKMESPEDFYPKTLLNSKYGVGGKLNETCL